MHHFWKKTSHADISTGRPRRPRRQRPGLEALEGRKLLSLGGESLVNSTTAHNQLMSDSASAANGLSVVVWVDEFSKSDRDIKAQMFNADGTKRGPQIDVDSSLEDSRSPSVAMDATGDWVVTWDQRVGGQRDILAQQFTSSGAKFGKIQAIAGSSLNETDPDVAMDAQGDYVVSYTKDTSATNSDVFARRFHSSGVLLQTITVANSQSSDESKPSVAMNADGAFVIGWQNENDGTGDQDIFLNRYNAAGTSIGGRPIAVSSTDESSPSVGLDDAGNAVVAYMKFVGTDLDIKARRVSADGLVGGEINIRNTSAQETNPTVALSRKGGSFVVAYNTDLRGVPGSRTVEVAEVSSSNSVGAVFNLPGFPNNDAPSLSIDAQGNYVLSYTGGVGSADTNIKLRRGHLS